jgi:uncharacterized protein (DUF2267 family)
MSLNCFNASLETTREWMQDLMGQLGTSDDAFAYRALRATLHELRDHLAVEEATHLAAQFPLLLKGVFFDGWRPTGKPVRERSKLDFLDRVGASFREYASLNQVEDIVRNVFEFLSRRVSQGEIHDVMVSLPKDIRTLWFREDELAKQVS